MSPTPKGRNNRIFLSLSLAGVDWKKLEQLALTKEPSWKEKLNGLSVKNSISRRLQVTIAGEYRTVTFFSKRRKRNKVSIN
ncbi:MAG: hypothetical protein WBM44_23840 [Waterburya sp.]